MTRELLEEYALKIFNRNYDSLSANEREKRRKEILESLGYGYDEVTGEVELLENIENEIYLDELVPTEKVNRQKKISKRSYYYGRRK